MSNNSRNNDEKNGKIIDFKEAIKLRNKYEEYEEEVQEDLDEEKEKLSEKLKTVLNKMKTVVVENKEKALVISTIVVAVTTACAMNKFKGNKAKVREEVNSGDVEDVDKTKTSLPEDRLEEILEENNVQIEEKAGNVTTSTEVKKSSKKVEELPPKNMDITMESSLENNDVISTESNENAFAGEDRTQNNNELKSALEKEGMKSEEHEKNITSVIDTKVVEKDRGQQVIQNITEMEADVVISEEAKPEDTKEEIKEEVQNPEQSNEEITNDYVDIEVDNDTLDEWVR